MHTNVIILQVASVFGAICAMSSCCSMPTKVTISPTYSFPSASGSATGGASSTKPKSSSVAGTSDSAKPADAGAKPTEAGSSGSSAGAPASGSGAADAGKSAAAGASGGTLGIPITIEFPQPEDVAVCQATGTLNAEIKTLNKKFDAGQIDAKQYQEMVTFLVQAIKDLASIPGAKVTQGKIPETSTTKTRAMAAPINDTTGLKAAGSVYQRLAAARSMSSSH